MRKQENSQIIETAKEARSSVRNVLVWSLGLVVAAFAVTFLRIQHAEGKADHVRFPRNVRL
jgi:hypothetical protein